jgi:hypothetical protein
MVFIFVIYLLILYEFKIIFILKKYYFILIGFLLGLLPYLIWAQIKFSFFLASFIFGALGVIHSFEPFYYYIFNFYKVFLLISIFGFLVYLFLKLKYRLIAKIKNIDLLFLLLIFVFGLYLFLTPHKELRYIIPIALPFFILSSIGLYKFALLFKKGLRAGMIILICILLIFSISPTFKRLNSPFINVAQSEEMVVSNFIKNISSKNSEVYTNINYPVFAYYTKLKTNKLDYTDYNDFKTDYNNLNKGYFIVYNDLEIPPYLSWFEKDNHFKLIHTTENISVFKNFN